MILRHFINKGSNYTVHIAYRLAVIGMAYIDVSIGDNWCIRQVRIRQLTIKRSDVVDVVLAVILAIITDLVPIEWICVAVLFQHLAGEKG